jgi:hypothetical protein
LLGKAKVGFLRIFSSLAILSTRWWLWTVSCVPTLALNYIRLGKICANTTWTHCLSSLGRYIH